MFCTISITLLFSSRTTGDANDSQPQVLLDDLVIANLKVVAYLQFMLMENRGISSDPITISNTFMNIFPMLQNCKKQNSLFF